MQKRADIATRHLAAILLAQPHDKCMKLIEKTWVSRQVVHKKVLQLIVSGLFTDHSVTVKDAVGIGINHENGALGRIKQDAVGGFRTYAIYRKKSLPEGLCSILQELLQIGLIPVRKESK